MTTVRRAGPPDADGLMAMRAVMMGALGADVAADDRAWMTTGAGCCGPPPRASRSTPPSASGGPRTRTCAGSLRDDVLMQPTIVERDEQPYIGRRESITMTEFAQVADHLPAMFGDLAARGVPITGAPFFRYRAIDMAAELVVEAGIPVAGPVPVTEPTFTDTLPAGRYATIRHIGHPDELVGVTARLLDWAQDQGLTFDMRQTPSGEIWACRLEQMVTNPAEEPDLHKWETHLYLKLA
jgi:effector-binding domain-containing protein